MNSLIRCMAHLPAANRGLSHSNSIPTIQFQFSLQFPGLFSSAALKPRATAKSISKSLPHDCSHVDTLCKGGKLKCALGVLNFAKLSGIPLDPDAYASLLQACSDMQSLIDGRLIHSRMLINGLDQNIYLGVKLVTMYISCRSMADARIVLNKLSEPNLKLWNVVIRGYASIGFPEEALELYYQMRRIGIQPDNFTFPFVLKACGSLLTLQEGKEIHYHIVKDGFESDVFVGTALIDMYAKCGSIEDARHVFDKMSKRDVVSWNAMIAGYAQSEHAYEAFVLFHKMQRAGIKPNCITMVTMLLACANLTALQQGKWVHNYVVRNGFESDVPVRNALASMYSKCGNVEIARLVFDKISQRNVVSWNTMIAGYDQNGSADEVLKLFLQMQLEGIRPDPVTIVTVLPACASLGSLPQGKKGMPGMDMPMRP